ncbi:TerD family protein [Streptomyces sp. NBC_01808]|uniref:TerD family protein n=1 Tax=Streptomyces sp. NBC_01808 TaxID=2975947 RepID=UPI002DD8BBE5|nr:TerD family protein [Streptomyces sp. NBC_01808]WSA37152.1 TerD family protein [Streptomyces sp. NBC_01808]
MTAELVRGQNHLLPQTRVEIRISAGSPVTPGATLGGEDGRVSDPGRIAHPGAPQLPGLEVPGQAAAEHRLAVDLDAVPPDVERVHVLLALPAGVPGPRSFGAIAPPSVAVTGLDGTAIARFVITGLDSESAVTAVELYRRGDAWKIRAVGQGYAGGLAAMLADQGLPEAQQLAADIERAVAEGLARAVAPAPPPTGQPTGPGARRPQQAAEERQAQAGPVDYRHPRRAAAAGAAGASGGSSGGPGTPGASRAPRAPASAAAPPPPGVGAGAGAGARPGAPAGAGSAAGGVPPQSDRSQSGPAAPVAGDAPGWSMEERLYNQVWGMFEDLARTVAAYRSAVEFADSRMDRELDQLLADPRARMGSIADSARAEVLARHSTLVDRAREVLDRDLGQLVAEAGVVEPALPPAFASWASPVWHEYEVPEDAPMALRLGDLHLPEHTELRVPLLVRLPLQRGLWVDSGTSSLGPGALEGDHEHGFPDSAERRALALDTAVAHAARLLSVHPAGEFNVHFIDPGGTATTALTPLLHSGVLAEPPPKGAAGVTDTLARLTQRIDLVQMALRSGAADALPPDLDPAQQLLVVNDFPHGFDDRAINQLRYLADEGPSVGVHLLVVADREDAKGYGPLLDPFWRGMLRLTPTPDDHLADPWIGHAWTYEPARAPMGSRVLEQVLAQVAAARRALRR